MRSNVDLVRAAVWALSVMSRADHDSFQPPWSNVLDAMYTVMYRFTDDQLLTYACHVRCARCVLRSEWYTDIYVCMYACVYVCMYVRVV